SYSFDLSPTDYHFFKHPNNFLINKLFRNEDCKSSIRRMLKTKEFYKFGIAKLVNLWEKST
ncbi:Histone-lysine N-methyltransferase SETMAR, partial [Habropoda laboriosa]